MFGSTAGGATVGPDLETIQTEGLGFLPLAGEAKVRLTSPWTPAPVPTASLLSVASRKGLVAAAGSDQIIIATTESVRKAFGSAKEGDSEIRPFEPQLRIPAPTRISHLAFTADENYLILSAESGGGLAVYDVQSLLQGSSNTAFELPTNSESLRLLAPNPTAEKAELCAVVTTNGNLYMANLKERKLSSPLKTQVSCLSWSAKGKQLCAGMGDGTICQMTPDGEGKGEIPQPPNFGSSYVSSLTWLENNLFLAIYSVANQSPPASVYHIINRQSSSSFTFQKLTDPVEPFGNEKAPHHAVLRLRDFMNLQDLIIVSSTASTEVGILTRSKTPLANDKPAKLITEVFTTTEFLEDTRRPTLPMTETMEDSVAVGAALDLSSKDTVYKPIPSDEELDQSPGPLPGFWVLTQEGLLCSWWLVYNDAVKKGQNYPGLSMMDSTSASGSTSAQATPSKPALSFSAPGNSAFGPSTTPTAAPAFGNSSQLGQKSSPWGQSTGTPAATGGAVFGSSTFGSSPGAGSVSGFGKASTLGFGQSSQLGMRSSPWSSGTGGKPAFGQSGFSSLASGGSNNQSPFGSAAFNADKSTTSAPVATSAPSGAAFSTFASQGGFASLGASTNSPGGFGSGSKFGSSSFGTPNKPGTSTDTGFSAKQDKPSSVFGSTPFKLESSFKADPFQKDSNEMSSGTAGSSMFGSAFGSALGDAAKKPIESTSSVRDEDMDTAEAAEETPQSKPRSIFAASQQSQESTTPTTTPAPSRFGFATSSTPGTSLFGQPTRMETPSSNPFSTQQDTPKPGAFSVFGASKTPESSVAGPKIKKEDQNVPLPPDTTSKAAYPLGDSSSSSATSNRSQIFGATSKALESDSATLSSDSTTPKPFLTSTAASQPNFSKVAKTVEAPDSLDFVKINKPSEESKGAKDADVPLPSDFTKKTVPEAAPLQSDFTRPKLSTEADKAPSDFALPKAPSREPSNIHSVPDNAADESDVGEDEATEDGASEGSGVDVAKDLSPSTSGLNVTPGFTPQSSFGGPAGMTPATARPEDRARPLFGEINRNAPLFPKPNQASPRSPSPMRGAVPQRVIRSDATRSVSAPGMASQILGPRQSQMHPGSSIISSREPQPQAEDSFLLQHRRMKERQEAEETQPLVDEEDDEVQKVLASEVEGTLELDEFIAHSNVVPPAKDSVPAQVEAVYRDINSMIDTLGLNARAVKAFTKGHSDNAAKDGRRKQDLEIPDDWVLCEIDELGNVLDEELHANLEDGRVQDLEDKLEACHDLSRDMQRLRAKQDDLKRVITARMDPDQAEYAQALPLSVEQAAQQNELRREFSKFTTILTEVEEALTLLKARIAAVSGSSGRGNTNMPTVEAVMRTISKMTAMAEKRSGDIDVLETQLRKMRLGSTSREGSPMVTPQARKSIMLSPDSTPSRNFRQSLTLSSSVMSLGGASKATPPRKKLSGFSKEEKDDLMEKRARRQAVLSKLKTSVGKRGVNVWNMEDIE
ncbi:hypothetical protein QQS21_003452 [Conoideocrella luteorostrata]|uniref:Nucleoporin Nup159/Nup146 N-terminal domain-containing protein n=1 Tax=Conoideocrella luteorostrata TaxID=1105319 RepID=A0AAJ0G0L5_9HYPO|nr:hypothetical protein QQS21_003452 [Conoideocrella luteorostrata]